MVELVQRVLSDPVLSGVGALASIVALVLTVLQIRTQRRGKVRRSSAPALLPKLEQGGLGRDLDVRSTSRRDRSVESGFLLPVWVGVWFIGALAAWAMAYYWWETSVGTGMYYRVVVAGVFITGGPYLASLVSVLLASAGMKIYDDRKVGTQFERVYDFALVSGSIFLMLFCLFMVLGVRVAAGRFGYE